MNAIKRTATILILSLVLAMPTLAQDTPTPKDPTPTAETVVEATVEPVAPIEPTETVDEINWFDDILEALGKLDVATLALGIGFVTMALQFRRPQTREEKLSTDAALELKLEEARQTTSKLDDMLIIMSSLINQIRPTVESQGTFLGDSAETTVTTTTQTTVDDARG